MTADLKEILDSPYLLKLVAENAFQIIDIDNNGYIDQEEFEKFFKEVAS